MSVPVVELEQISRSYGDVTPLRDVSLTVEPGEFLVITGASGSGKSTLLAILGLMEAPDSGSYLLQGSHVARLSDSERARLRNRTFGFVFQQFSLIPALRVWENVARPLSFAGLNRKMQKARALQVLTEAGISELANRRPAQLSGGEQQRVAIARALINDPELILADEPTGNLPVEQWQPIFDDLEKLRSEGRTIVVASHDPGVIKRASRVLRLGAGRIHNIAPLRERDQEPLRLNLLGKGTALRAGNPIRLTGRQADLLALLAANPQGLSGEQLLLLAYGENGKPGTLKSGISRLRSKVRIAAQPYRIDEPFEADFLVIQQQLLAGKLAAASETFGFGLLPASEAPGVVDLREQLEEDLRQSTLSQADPEPVYRLAQALSDDLEIWEAAVARLPPVDPRRALAQSNVQRLKRAWD